MLDHQHLRILHCFRSPIGGIFRHVRDLVQAQDKAGHHVGIICDSTTGGAYEDALFDEISPSLKLGLIRLPIRRAPSPSDLMAVYSAYTKIKSLRPDIVHGHGAKGGVLVRLVGSLLRVSQYRVARFYSPHGGSLHYDKATLQGSIIFKIERFLERWTDRLVFVADYERQVYENKIGSLRSPWVSIYNGISEAEFAPVMNEDDAADFLYIGMMRDLKGPDLFIEAIYRAEKQAGRPIKAAMVGDGADKPRYQNRINDLGLADRVKMYDAMPARKAFTLARTVVVPSRSEAMPDSVLETGAAQKHILSTKVGGIPEILGESYSGFVEPDNIDSLAQAMVRDIKQPDWLEKAAPDRCIFRDTFSSTVMAERMMKTYKQVIAEIT